MHIYQPEGGGGGGGGILQKKTPRFDVCKKQHPPLGTTDLVTMTW